MKCCERTDEDLYYQAWRRCSQHEVSYNALRLLDGAATVLLGPRQVKRMYAAGAERDWYVGCPYQHQQLLRATQLSD